jgi:hypothetical protein
MIATYALQPARRRHRRRIAIGKWQIASLGIAFLLAGITTAILCDGYITKFVRVRECMVRPPGPNLTLVSCGDVSSQFYYSGSLYLDIDKELVESLRRADVVIVGNSRTQRTFASRAIEQYFTGKNLRYFVLASEGSGFRFTQLILEKIGARPPILLVNNESFYVDVLDDTNRDVVLYPEKFATALSAFYYSKKLQEWICASSLPLLKGFYCRGTAGGWRGVENGSIFFPAGYYPDPPGRILVEVPSETRMNYFAFYVKNARNFLASPSVKDGCLINYVIPSNNSSVDLARQMAEEMGAAFVFPSPDNYYTADGSHLVPESSERWSTEFVRLADAYVDECIARRRNRGSSTQ